MLVPLYHADSWWALERPHSDPGMYRDADGDMLALLAPQLALMLAIEGSVQPVIGASIDQCLHQTLTATAEEIHASSQEVAASARRASEGAAQAARLVTTLARDSDQLTQHAAEVAARAPRHALGAQMSRPPKRSASRPKQPSVA